MASHKKPTQEMFVDEQPASVKEATEVLENSVVANILDLPSKGQLGYPSTVEYRDILVKDEEVLASASVDTYARTLNKALKGILNGCEFFEKMTTHDRDFVLIWMWAANYSPTKKVEVTCPKCKHEFGHTVDFTKQNITDINPKFTGSYKMTLKNGTDVSIRLNTVSDENQAEQFLAKKSDYRYEHLMMVLSIDFPMSEMLPLQSRIDWVEASITGAEMSKIKKFHSLFRYGVDSKIEYDCPECKAAFHAPFPFQAEDILFPAVQADIEEFL